MLKIIIFFVALALIIYFFDRPIVPQPIERDPAALALAGQIEKCTRIYGNEHSEKGLCELSEQLLEEHG